MSGFTVLYAILLVAALLTSAQTGNRIAIAQSLPDRDERFRSVPFIKKIWGLYAFVIGNALFTVFLIYQLVTVR